MALGGGHTEPWPSPGSLELILISSWDALMPGLPKASMSWPLPLAWCWFLVDSDSVLSVGGEGDVRRSPGEGSGQVAFCLWVIGQLR
jgi:hypothetical protein